MMLLQQFCNVHRLWRSPIHAITTFPFVAAYKITRFVSIAIVEYLEKSLDLRIICCLFDLSLMCLMTSVKSERLLNRSAMLYRYGDGIM